MLDTLSGEAINSADREARDIIRTALGQRHLPTVQRTVDSITDHCLRSNAQHFVITLSELLGVQMENLDADDRLSDVISVRISDLSVENQAALSRRGVGPLYQVYAYDIVHLLQTRISAAAWSRSIRPKYPNLTGDDEWIDTIVQLTIREVIDDFGVHFE